MERRRRFEHLFVELSVALGELVPRYALWLRIGEFGDPDELGEHGGSPETLSRAAAVAFCRQELQGFLGEHGLELAPRKLRRLIRAVSRFDSQHATPEEQLRSLFERILDER